MALFKNKGLKWLHTASIQILFHSEFADENLHSSTNGYYKNFRTNHTHTVQAKSFRKYEYESVTLF